jgi:hypothetical protein
MVFLSEGIWEILELVQADLGLFRAKQKPPGVGGFDFRFWSCSSRSREMTHDHGDDVITSAKS